MSERARTTRKQRKTILAILLLLLAIAAIAAIILAYGRHGKRPTVRLDGPTSVAASDRNELVFNLVVSDLSEGVYPAASVSISFDRNKLEFVGIRQGTMMTLDGKTSGQETRFAIPTWSADAGRSNQTGTVNTMYLDLTGGDYAYTKDGFGKGDRDILLRVVFRLRDSAIAGDKYTLSVVDAVFATIDNQTENNNLATADDTLGTKPATIKVK